MDLLPYKGKLGGIRVQLSTYLSFHFKRLVTEHFWTVLIHVNIIAGLASPGLTESS